MRIALRWLFALGFVLAGANHFREPAFYLRMMPPYLPQPAALVAISGAFEILGGIFLLIPATGRLAAWGLIALLIAVFPANIQMAVHPELFPEFSRVALLVRLPFQIVMIWWAWLYSRPVRRA